MASSEKFQHDQNPPSSGLTRRQFLPLLGATAALAAVAPRSFAKRPSDAQARFVYVGTYTFPGVPPGGTHPLGFRHDRADLHVASVRTHPVDSAAHAAAPAR